MERRRRQKRCVLMRVRGRRCVSNRVPLQMPFSPSTLGNPVPLALPALPSCCSVFLFFPKFFFCLLSCPVLCLWLCLWLCLCLCLVYNLPFAILLCLPLWVVGDLPCLLFSSKMQSRKRKKKMCKTEKQKSITSFRKHNAAQRKGPTRSDLETPLSPRCSWLMQ